MQSQLSEISPVLVEVQIEVPWQRVEKDLNDTFREVARTAKVRGFRPGKVPNGVVRQMYGKQVRAQVTGSLVEQGLMHAVREHELNIVAEPQVAEPPALAQGEPLRFSAKIEVRPTIDNVAFKAIEVWKEPIEIEDAAVDAEVEILRQRNADIQSPEPMRPAQAGDLLTIDYDVEIDGEVAEKMGAKGRQIELGDDLLPALREGLLGAQPGDTRDIEVPFEDDHPNPELKGKTTLFKARVNELHERILPELDDEFAKDCGEYETLLELRLDIRKRLEDAAEQQRESGLREQMIDAIIEHNDVPVPPSLIQQQKQMMLYEMAQLMQMSGQRGAPGEEFFSGLEGRAERRVKAGLLLGALARQESLSVDESDLDRHFQQIAERSGQNLAKIRADYQGEQRQQLESRLLEDKIMGFLLERVQVKDGAPPAKADSQAAGEEPAAAKQKAPAKKKAAAKKKAPAKKKTAAKKKAPAKKKKSSAE